jgi:peptidoglycan/xylan/chitin deacetylase (PgdA/CDA1 family)
LLTRFLTQYLPPLLVAVIVMLAFVLVVAILARSGSRAGGRAWRLVVQQRVAFLFLGGVVLFIVAFATFLVRQSGDSSLRAHENHSFNSVSNLISTSSLSLVPLDDNNVPIQSVVSGTGQVNTRSSIVLRPKEKVASNVIIVRQGETYLLSLYAATMVIDAPAPDALAQIRLTWLNSALNVLSWDDTRIFAASGRSDYDTAGFYSSSFTVPANATHLQVEFRNIDTGGSWLRMQNLNLTSQGVYVESHPNGAQGAIAFSFDWESAMGGAIHSQGMEGHDVAGATQHGLLMRQGANSLNKLFTDHNIHATFYATGYNLLDGNTEHRTFSGDPIYKWAKPKNNWSTDYWLTHGWFSDDPFGTYKTDPAWYFGDQTRALLAAGHEIAPHTFGHIYVRGSNPTEFATDMDEWLKAAKAQGVPPPSTFAFPWRSSNSLTPDFYDVLYDRGIRAVTRLYAPDLRDLYTIGAAPVYSYMAVMPDFRLGAPSSNAGEEASGAEINLDQGLQVITETLARRGTTSFWTHPEQLGDSPRLQPVKDAWTGVVEAAARERDAGRLWIATVAEITAYQRDVMSVTVGLGKDPSGGWKMAVTNDSGHDIAGVTLTLPGDAVRLSSTDAEIRTVVSPLANETRLSPPGQPSYPARQVVITTLKPGTTTIDVEWAKDQEPQT